MLIGTLQKCLVIFLMVVLIKESTPFKLVTKQEVLDSGNELPTSLTTQNATGKELENLKLSMDLETGDLELFKPARKGDSDQPLVKYGGDSEPLMKNEGDSEQPLMKNEGDSEQPLMKNEGNSEQPLMKNEGDSEQPLMKNGDSEPTMRKVVSEPSLRIDTSDPSTPVRNTKAAMLAKFKEFSDSAAQEALVRGDNRDQAIENLKTADQKTSKYSEAPRGKKGDLKGESYDQDALKGRGFESNDSHETEKMKLEKNSDMENVNDAEMKEIADGKSEKYDETLHQETKDDVEIVNIDNYQENGENIKKGQQIPLKKKLRIRRDTSMEKESKNIDIEDDKLSRKALNDVTNAPTNQRQEAASTSVDVTEAAANERQEVVPRSDDATGGVGGRSMNEMLVEMFKDSLPASLEPTEGDCHLLKNFTVRCSSNMFSMCGSANSYMNVMVENGHGGHKFTKERPMAYGVSPITGRDDRWELSDSPNLWDLMPGCSSCFGKSPLVRIVGPKGSLCRVRIHCTPSPDEALFNLPSEAQNKCSSRPFLRTTAKLLKLPGWTEYSTGTTIQLGETLVLRLEAEADFTSSTLLGDGRFISLTDSKPLPIGLHVQKCWVGSQDTNQANLVIDECSTAPVIGNFTEFTTSHSQTPYNRVIGVAEREGDDSDALSKRVVHETNITAFVMSRSDQKVDITCMVKVCVGVCLENSTCLQSSRPKKDLDTPPLYSKVHNLTVSMSPATDSTKIQSAVTEEKPPQMKAKPNLEANVNTNSSLTNKTAAPQAQIYSKESINSERGCLSYSTFILSLTVISILYLVILVAFVILHSKKSGKDFIVSPMSPPHMVCTPSRTYFPDGFTARKRTPPSISDRYIY